MRRSIPEKRNIQTDLAFVTIVLLIFTFFIFMIYQPENSTKNFIIAAIVFMIIIITHFSTIAIGLIMNTVLILAYISFLVVQSITKGGEIGTYVYFWILESPALTVAFSLYASSMKTLQRQVSSLDKKLGKLSTLNETTQIKNLRAYENDANIYINIAKRYGSDFAVLLIKYRYQKEINMLLHRDEIMDVTLMVAEAIREAMRAEDELYQFDNYEVMFGLLLLTKEGFDIIRERLKKTVAELDTNKLLNMRHVVIDIQVGVAFAKGEETPLALLDSAKRDMIYDV